MTIRYLSLVMILILLAPVALAQQIYIWKDENGQWQYSNYQPPGVSVTETQGTVWAVQVASFSQKGNADKLARNLKEKEYDSYVVLADVKGRTWYRVWVGHLASQDEAKQLLLILKEKENYRKAFITSERLNLRYDP